MQHVWRIRQGEEEEKMKDYSNSRMEMVINEYIHSARNREILKARYIDGMTYEMLAEKFDLSVTQTKRIIYKHENILFKYL